jgi:hypothetical protein
MERDARAALRQQFAISCESHKPCGQDLLELTVINPHNGANKSNN